MITGFLLDQYSAQTNKCLSAFFILISKKITKVF